ncbi:MAG: hypothetical protein KBD24_00755 [Candidatus Pacebacteria bacterium]|nr:hypothetical protein [Candidatus Paceibacterota bacterium]
MEQSVFDKELFHCYATLSDALAKNGARRSDHLLRQKVESFLGDDVPEPFREGHVFYLARHVATPNFETLFFLDIASHLEWTPVIGQDQEDKFVSVNSLKHALGKLPIITEVSSNGREHLEHVTVLDFNNSNGRPLRELTTFRGTPLVEFHNSLFPATYPEPVYISNESTWIDRHHRGKLLEHYKKHFALFILHGISFEYFDSGVLSEELFFYEVFKPAFEFVTQHFGCEPLIVPLITPSIEPQKKWEAYPNAVYDHAKKHQSKAMHCV